MFAIIYEAATYCIIYLALIAATALLRISDQRIGIGTKIVIGYYLVPKDFFQELSARNQSLDGYTGGKVRRPNPFNMVLSW